MSTKYIIIDELGRFSAQVGVHPEEVHDDRYYRKDQTYWMDPVESHDDLPLTGNKHGDVRMTFDEQETWLWIETAGLGADGQPAVVADWYAAISHYWSDPVATYDDLPSTGNLDGEVKLTKDTDDVYKWDEATSSWVDVHEDLVLRNEWLQNGFNSEALPDLSWDDASRTVTVQPGGTGGDASFHYFLEGIHIVETDTYTETILDEEGLWVVYIDAVGSMTSIKNPSDVQINSVILNYTIVAYVYWDATNKDGRLLYELHGDRMAPPTHLWLHNNIGATYRGGMTLADFVISDGNDDEDAQFSVGPGDLADEDLRFALDAVAKTTGLEIWHLDGSNWRWTTNPGFSILTTGSGRMAWNDAGAQTEVGLTNFALCHVFATNIVDDDGTSPKYITIQGQAEYTTLKLARAGAEVEINTLAYGTLPLEEIIPVATVIFQSGPYGNAVKSRVVQTEAGDNYVDWRASSLKASGGSIADHGALAGLSDDDHEQYILADGTRIYTGTGDGFKDEDNMASDSAVAVASQQSIKKYVDDSTAADWWLSPIDTEAGLPLSGNTDGQVRLTKDTNDVFRWDAGASDWIDIHAGIVLWEIDGTETQLKTADEIDMQSKNIVNVLDPTLDQHAATKIYVDDNDYNITSSTSDPSGGDDGDIWLKHEA